jgi:hypothetical protein
MKLIFHHLAKDIRSQRWLLLLSILVIALQLGIDLLEAQADYHLASTAEFVHSTMALPLASDILWILLLARLIQSEPVTGATSFWLTRPIPRGVYISSKLLFILFFLVIPYLLPVPLDMFHFGVAPEQIRAKVETSLIIDLYLTLIILWLATYTRTIVEFWGALIAFVLFSIAIGATAVYSRFYFVSNAPDTAGLGFTRLALFILTFFSGLFVSLVMQHTRRKAAGFGVGVSCMVVAVLVGFFWPFPLPWTFTNTFLFSGSTFSVKSVTIKYADDWQQRLSWERNPNTQEWLALSAFSPLGTTSREVPIIQNINVTFKPDGGGLTKLSNDVAGNMPVQGQFDVERAIAADFPGIQLSNLPARFNPGSFSLFVVHPSDEHLVGKTGTLKLTLFGHMQSLVREAAIPLNGQLVASRPGEIIHIARLPRVPQTFIPPETADNPVLAVWTLGYFERERFEPPPRYYVLVDSQNGTGTFLHTVQAMHFNDNFSMLGSKSSGHVYLPLQGNEPLDQMVLYIYEFKANDFLNATLTAPGFVMNPHNN